jgi:hypothetical protein
MCGDEEGENETEGRTRRERRHRPVGRTTNARKREEEWRASICSESIWHEADGSDSSEHSGSMWRDRKEWSRRGEKEERRERRKEGRVCSSSTLSSASCRQEHEEEGVEREERREGWW